MRHQHSGRQLGRNSPHRKAMFRNMAASLFRHERIRTTLPKAKELRRVAEPLITLSRKDVVARRRRAFDLLRDREMVTKLFNELGPRYSKRPGGYLRILKCGFRAGDNAPMAIVELVEAGDSAAGKPTKSGAGKANRKSGSSQPASSGKGAATSKAPEQEPDKAGVQGEEQAQPKADTAPEQQTQEAADQQDEKAQTAAAADEPKAPEATEDSAGEADAEAGQDKNEEDNADKKA